MRDRRATAAAYAELVRVPNLFTAPPDVLLGAALLARTPGTAPPQPLVLLALASVALYAAGTSLNDAFDAPIDERERPERPIPSGRVSRSGAFATGGLLLLVGITLATVAAGVAGGGVASLLALAILAYDGLLKGSPLGSLAMGSTRGLNVLLGATAGGALVIDRPTPLVVAGVVALYIAAVTQMAERETTGGNRTAVVVAGVGAVGAALAVGAYVLSVQPPTPATAVSVALAAGFLAWTGRALRRAYLDPAPDHVGAAVGACVLGIVVLDAAFAAVSGVGWGAVVLVFLAPAVLLARALAVT